MYIYSCVDYCLFFCPISFGHFIVFPSIYDFWLPLWYLQTFLQIWIPKVWCYCNCFSFLDNIKQPAAILVLQYWYTILVIPVFYQNLPVSAILVQILVNTSIPESSSICNTRRYWSLAKYEYCRYRKILGNTGNTSIADTGGFWEILVIPVLQILEDSGKYW